MTMKIALGLTLLGHCRMANFTALACDAEPWFMTLVTVPFKFSMGTITGQ
jgi:hypothetical protein